MIVVLIINFGLICFFTTPIYPLIGIVYTLLSILGTFLLSDSPFGQRIINKQITVWGENMGNDSDETNKILLSSAFLSLGMKIGAVITALVYGSAALMIAIALLLASGFFFSGSKSGVTPGGAFTLGKLLVKVYGFVTTIFDKVVELFVKLEFAFLGIDKK